MNPQTVAQLILACAHDPEWNVRVETLVRLLARGEIALILDQRGYKITITGAGRERLVKEGHEKIVRELQ